ncbi:hypothetical protein DRO47_06435 [Candidatus Bathyarchaeota archaeon]|nr:MAG: hypothetical protein DRO47_06435 [Candidatus Bathyarchaeota archaeon]
MLRDKPSERKNPVLEYIRENVTLNRVREVENVLSEWWGVDMSDPKQYFDSVLMESVYRGHKGSYKIDSCKLRGIAYLQLILYILFGEPNFDPVCVLSKENIAKIKKALKKHFKGDGYFARLSLRYLNVKTGKRVKGTMWIDIEPYIYPLLGGEIFFYCTLTALIDVAKRALTDKEYDYFPIMNWKEGIVEYLVSELVENQLFEEDSLGSESLGR